jgi:exodeoxyribonuclease III
MPGKEIKIISWNVAGLRGIWKKDFPKFIAESNPDIVCLQETKAMAEQLDDEIKSFNGYHSDFCAAEKKGYSGVGIYSKQKPNFIKHGLGNPYFDAEGRLIRADFNEFTIYNVYFPNGGRGPERVKYKLDFYNELFFQVEKQRKKQKNIIVCGDYNTAHKEIDLARPKENEFNSGFLPEERAWMDTIENLGFVDVFRKFNSEPGQYTYWDNYTLARPKNIGWRIDYFFVTKEMLPKVRDAKIHMEVMGSDHCPIELRLV